MQGLKNSDSVNLAVFGSGLPDMMHDDRLPADNHGFFSAQYTLAVSTIAHAETTSTNWLVRLGSIGQPAVYEASQAL